MTRREFVINRFAENINDALATIDNNGKGQYRQYIDSWEQLIVIDFEVKNDLVIANITGDRYSDHPFKKEEYDYLGYAKITTTLHDALVDLIEYAHRVTGYRPAV